MRGEIFLLRAARSAYRFLAGAVPRQDFQWSKALEKFAISYNSSEFAMGGDMAAKIVNVFITSHPLSREENGVVFKVKNGNAHFGELVVSKGGIRWRPRKKQDHHFASWQALDSAMRSMPKK